MLILNIASNMKMGSMSFERLRYSISARQIKKIIRQENTKSGF